MAWQQFRAHGQSFIILGSIALIYCTFLIGNKSIQQLEVNSWNSQWPPTDKIVVMVVTGPPYGDEIVKNGSLLFHYYLPFSVVAWKRFNYSSFIIVCGTSAKWLNSGHYLNTVYQQTNEIGQGFALFHFIDQSAIDSTLIAAKEIAQTMRIYAAAMSPIKNHDDKYMILSDIDYFPLRNIYELPADSNCVIKTSMRYRRKISLYDNKQNKPIPDISNYS